MTKQKPTCGVKEFEALRKAGLDDRGNAASHISTPWRVDRKYPGESDKALRARLVREREIQEDRDNEKRRDYFGRVHPVFIE